MATATKMEKSKMAIVPMGGMGFRWVETASLLEDLDNERENIQEGLDELIASVKERGILEPLRVREIPFVTPPQYVVQSGHRRRLAALAAGLTRVPCMVVSYATDEESQGELAIDRLTTNLQRKDLSPLERAKGLRAVLDTYPGMTQARLGEMLGLAQPTIANALRVLDLPEKVQQIVVEGGLTAGHCGALLQVKSPKYEWSGKPLGTVEDAQVELAQRFVENTYSVEMAQNHVKNHESNADYQRRHEAEMKRWEEQKVAEAKARDDELAKQGKTMADVERERRDAEAAASKAKMARQRIAWSSLRDSTRIDPKDGPSLAHLKLAALSLNHVVYNREEWQLEKQEGIDAHILACTERGAVVGWIALLALAGNLIVGYGDNFLPDYNDKLKWADKTWHINEHIVEAFERAGLAVETKSRGEVA